MKITIDTDKIKENVVTKIPSFSLRDYTDREVFFISLLVVFFGYIIADVVDSRRFRSVESRIGQVEVTLEKVVNRMNDNVLNDSAEVPKSKFTSLYNTHKKISLDSREFDCLARNIYWESMREPLLGQIAVANVTYNRVKSGKWGNTFCDVVFSKSQFSWTLFKKIRNARPKNAKQWERARHSAMLFTNGVRVQNLSESQFYYADYIKRPSWSKDMNRVAKIGKHIFYAQN